MMRAIWKPDVSRLTRANAPMLEGYFAKALPAGEHALPPSVLKLAAMAEIITHKFPRTSVLELGHPTAAFSKYLFGDILRGDTDFKRCASYTRGRLDPATGVYTQPVDASHPSRMATRRPRPSRASTTC